MAIDYPRPVETPTNEPLLRAWRAGRLDLQSCSACALCFFYPREVCPRCWSPELVWKPAAGTGQVAGYTLIERPLHPAFEAELPIVLAEITLPEGASMLARIVGDDRTEVRTGRAVRLVQLSAASRYPLPTFELA